MKSLETANKGLKALAKENPSLVEDKFGYDVPGYMMGGIANFAPGGSVFGPMMLSDPTLMPGSDINIPNIESGKDIDFSDVFDKDAQDEAQEDLDDFIYDFEKDGGIDAGTRDPDKIAKIIKDKKTPKEKMKLLREMLSMVGDSNDFSQLVQSQLIRGSQPNIPQLRRLQRGGIAGLNIDVTELPGYDPKVASRARRAGNLESYINSLTGNMDIDDYIQDVLGMEMGDTPNIASDLATAYGAKTGIGSLGYSDTRPGARISIDAKDVTPDVYRFYPSEVSKIYSQAKGVPFSPLVAPPREATYVDALQPRRIASQLYAKEGTFVDREKLVTGPGGEKGDEIPAMLSDGEFVTNSAAVRGMGIMAGADPQDEYEQRLMGAREMYKMQKFGEDIAKQLA
tara:strand:- start:434 stop:1624 length:1191 start_codon:yes stop_codon:yes gene_type:complete